MLSQEPYIHCVHGQRQATAGRAQRARRRRHEAVDALGHDPAILVVVLFAGGIFGYYVVQNNAKQEKAAALAEFTPSDTNKDPSTKIPGVIAQQYTGAQHVQPNQTVAYTHSPPFGGPHDGDWAACNGVVYTTPVRNENMVHALEHGSVWIAYNPDKITGAAVQTLAARINGQPTSSCPPTPGWTRRSRCSRGDTS